MSYLSDSSSEPPKLRIYLNLDNIEQLPEQSIGHGLVWPEGRQRLVKDGFEGVQLGMTHSPVSAFPFVGLNRINHPRDSDDIIKRHAERGDACITLHVGWGLESNDEACRLIESILTASQKRKLPVFFETHRATITQDIWRTVEWTKVFPEIRFNGDFSHYYCGLEMAYGNMNEKWDFMQPIFDRIGFLHGRIASPGCMQAPIEAINRRPRHAIGERDYLADFKEMWIRSMRGFKKNAQEGDVLIFTPELLHPKIYYARLHPDANGSLCEESDRYQQALLFKEIAQLCWVNA